ncbi:MAG: copper chaperone PCu(A)C [Actinomycetes bacterium]
MSLLAGCGDQPVPIRTTLPYGGVSTTVGSVHLDDVWLEGAGDVTAGASAPVRVALTNDARVPDRLVRVTSPDAGLVVLRDNGTVVTSLRLPAGQQVNLEYRNGIELTGLRRPIQSGGTVRVTFWLDRAGPRTVTILNGPLGVRP